MNRRRFLTLAAGAAALPLPARAISVPPLWRLDLVNAHTGETFRGAFRDEQGPLPDALNDLSYFLRDFHCDKEIRYDVTVLDFLTHVIAAVGATRVTILSAYRAPETNAMLARTVFGVAENSQHMYGRALDIYLPARLEDAMYAARAMKFGGVGWYPNSGFIHVDTGPVRNWQLYDGGLRTLLNGRDGHRVGRGNVGEPIHDPRYRPELEHSGRLLPELDRSGRLSPTIEQSGRPLPRVFERRQSG